MSTFNAEGNDLIISLFIPTVSLIRKMNNSMNLGYQFQFLV